MKKAIFFGTLLAVTGIMFWYFVIRIDKKKAVNIIFKADTKRDVSKIEAMDENYLISWAKAIKSAESKFDHNGKTYSTGTGTEIKS